MRDSDPLTQATSDFRPDRGPGAVVGGRYTLVEKLGEGGMGEVWAARQSDPVRRAVALKLIKPGMDSKAVLARFEQERQALALMDHPGIARVYDGGLAHEGRSYFVMELVAGPTLDIYCDREKLTVRERLGLFAQVCLAVQHAHQKGVIHRDLKPSNILVATVDGRPVPKVIDFGVAKAMSGRLTDATLTTQFGAVLGTLEYMSPEQAGQTTQDVDTRADIYSLGVVLYELLTGLRPFDEARLRRAALDEMVRILREEEPARPSTRLSTADSLPTAASLRRTEPARLTALVRGELDWIVMKCLEKQRDRRYETAAALARDVQHYLADEPVEAGPPSRAYRLRKFLRRHRVAVTATLVVWLITLAQVAFSTVQWFNARAERDRAEEARAAEADQRRLAERQTAMAVAEKKRADAERNVAVAVLDFLRDDLLGQADISNQPAGVPRDPNLTVRTLAERAARGIEARFRDQPLTEAAIRGVLGHIESTLGRYEQSRTHFARVVSLRTAAQGPTHEDTLEAKNDLAEAYFMQHRYAEAEALMDEVYRVRAQTLGERSPKTVMVRHNLASLYECTGRFPAAEAILKELLAQSAAMHGEDHRDTNAIRYTLGRCYVSQAMYGPAETLLRRSLAWEVARRGKDHPRSILERYYYTQALSALSRHAEAEKLAVENYDLARAKLGADHPFTLSIRSEIGYVHLHRGDTDGAAAVFRAVLSGLQHQPEANLEQLVAVKHGLAAAETKRQKYAEAERLFREALAEAGRLPGNPVHRDGLQSDLALLYFDMGRYDLAIPLYQELHATLTKSDGPDHPRTLLAAFNLAANYRYAGRPEDAAKWLDEWLPRAGQVLPLDDYRLLFGRRTALGLYIEQKQPDKEEAVYRLFMDASKRQKGDGSPEYNGYAATLARLYLRLGRYADARPLLEKCLADRAKNEADSWTLYNTKSLLGGCHLGLKNYTTAEPLLLDGYRGMLARLDRLPEGTHEHVTQAADYLIRLYTETGKPDETRKWQAEKDKLLAVLAKSEGAAKDKRVGESTTGKETPKENEARKP